MRRIALALLWLAFAMPIAAADDTITYCPTGTFADCTEARDCRPGQTSTGEDAYLCRCPTREGDSVTTGGCTAATAETAQSRYPGVASMGVCTSVTNEWADCLGVPCQATADSSDVECVCNVARSNEIASTQYVIVGVAEAGAAQVCASDMHNSSATPGQVFDATSVLRSGRAAQPSGPETLDPELSWIYP